MDFLVDMGTELVNRGVATVGMLLYGTKSGVPAGSGPYVSLIDSGGTGRDRIQNAAGGAYRYPGAMVQVRGVARQATHAKALEIAGVLDEINNKVINDTFYRSVRTLQEPGDMGLDDTNQRIVFWFNILGDRQS